MKKLVAIVSLVLAMMLCVCACAETVSRQKNVDMEAQLADMNLSVGFAVSDITDKDIAATIYDMFTYDIVDIGKLQAGDIIETAAGDITVETCEKDNGEVLINGGEEEGGVTLWADEESNCYMQVEWGMPTVIAVGQAQLMLKDTVAINVYQMDEDLSPVGDGFDTVEVAAADVAAEMTKLAEKLGDEFSPYQTSVTMEGDGVISDITITYMP